ncbi:hypothetical protein CBR_g3622 [Chara braunii]|uniref:Uncharacterized protein n=1 Tax=Chara braunii TaxID=69332 RepID=A0A388KG21_CHABU|nr:hypothetical protein CBR_g3622 [Chara braunii]|eukprot:GBG68923.1 hypothetical protein CBR_g3622 [Chara braunii]
MASSTAQMAMEAASVQDAIAAAMLGEEGAALEIVRMHKQQMEEIHTALIQHRPNLPADLLGEGEELVSGWDAELHADLSSQRPGAIEKAQAMVELGGCAEVLKKVRRIFDELREELYGSLRCDDVKGCCCDGPEEGQELRTMSQDCSYVAEGVLRRGRLEEGQGSYGELEERDNDASMIGSHLNTNFSTESNDIAGDDNHNINGHNNDDDNNGDNYFEVSNIVADDNNNNINISKNSDNNGSHNTGDHNNAGDDLFEAGDAVFPEVVVDNENGYSSAFFCISA